MILLFSTCFLESRKLKESSLTKVKIFINDNGLFDKMKVSDKQDNDFYYRKSSFTILGAIEGGNFFIKDKEEREGFNLIYRRSEEEFLKSSPYQLSSEPNLQMVKTFIPLAGTTNYKIEFKKPGILNSFTFDYIDKAIKVQILSDKEFSDIKDMRKFIEILSTKFTSQALKEFINNKNFLSKQIESLEMKRKEFKINFWAKNKIMKSEINDIEFLKESLNKAKERLKDNLAFFKSQNISKEVVNEILDSNFKSEKEKFEEVKEIFEDIINDKA